MFFQFFFSIEHNKSQRFESRFVTVQIESETSFWFKGLENARMGVWVAHGEGQFVTNTRNVKTALRYVDPVTGESTEMYPQNPNGSADGIAGIYSEDGRVLGLMPHPERCFKSWQLPWCPQDWKQSMEKSGNNTPWIKMFQNAYDWCAKKTL